MTNLKDDAAAKSVEHEIVACIRPDIAGTFSINAHLADAVDKHATDCLLYTSPSPRD